MDGDAIIKRISAIGAELVALQKQREDIDRRTMALIREAHRLTQPKAIGGAGDVDAQQQHQQPDNVKKSDYDGIPPMRRGEPTVRFRTLVYLGEVNYAVSKYELAQVLKVNPVQAQYALVALKKQGLATQPSRNMWVLTERGKAESNKCRSIQVPTITVEGEAIPDSRSDAR